jgi:hypothetical protein
MHAAVNLAPSWRAARGGGARDESPIHPLATAWEEGANATTDDRLVPHDAQLLAFSLPADRTRRAAAAAAAVPARAAAASGAYASCSAVVHQPPVRIESEVE